MKNFFSLLGLFLTFSVFGQTGSIDKTFGKAGYKVVEGNYNDSGFSTPLTGLQSDGKIVYAYSIVDPNKGKSSINLTRINSDGSVDKAFGKNGIATLDAEFEESASALQIAQNGKIWVLTYALKDDLGLDADFALYRFNIDGTIDLSFNTKGYKYFGNTGEFEAALDFKILANGDILLSGVSTPNPDNGFDATVFKVKSDGTLDKTFGTGGVAKVLIVSETPIKIASDIELDSQGSIFIAGSAIDLEGTIGAGFIVKIKSNGTVDPTFGNAGMIEVNGPNKEFATFNNMELQKDGKILVTQQITNDDETIAARLIRFSAIGKEDATFGTKGVVDVMIGDNAETSPNDIKIQPNGQILVNYSSYVEATFGYNNVTGRYNANGAIDATFGKKGYFTVVSDSVDYLTANILLQSDGKILISAESDLFDKEVGVRTFYRLLNPPAVATEDITLTTNLSVSPNPMENEVSVKYTLENAEPNLSIEFVNLQGQVVKNSVSNEKRNAGEQTERFNVSELSTGVYFVKIKTPSKVAQMKVVKM
jgi:uncharacterized delta-60 repeat protein